MTRKFVVVNWSDVGSIKPPWQDSEFEYNIKSDCCTTSNSRFVIFAKVPAIAQTSAQAILLALKILLQYSLVIIQLLLDETTYLRTFNHVKEIISKKNC